MTVTPEVTIVSVMESLPDVVTVRVVTHTLPGAILVEAGEGRQGTGTAATSKPADPRDSSLAESPQVAMMGAEAVLIALGYHQLDPAVDVQGGDGLVVGRFRKAGSPAEVTDEPEPEDEASGRTDTAGT